MQHQGVADLAAVAAALARLRADVILIGGAAAVLHGSALGTTDVDFIHRRDADNVQRLLRFCREGEAFFRHDLGHRRLAPQRSHLEGAGALLLSTRWGPVDLLGALHDGRGYDELIAHTITCDLQGAPLRVLDLETLIRVKAAVGRAKDRLAVAELLALARRAGAGEADDVTR